MVWSWIGVGSIDAVTKIGMMACGHYRAISGVIRAVRHIMAGDTSVRQRLNHDRLIDKRLNHAFRLTHPFLQTVFLYGRLPVPADLSPLLATPSPPLDLDLRGCSPTGGVMVTLRTGR